MCVIRLAAATVNQTPLDWPGNEQRIRSAIDAARNAGAALVCLPELCVTGYGCEDAFLSPHLWRRAEQSIARLLPHTQGMAVVVGAPVRHDSRTYNTAVLLVDGAVRGVVPKQHLAKEGVHYEPRWFTPWSPGKTSETALAGHAVPFGDLVFDVHGVRIGFEICEDAWVPMRTGIRLAAANVDVVCNLSASHFSFGKHRIRRNVVVEGSRSLGAAYVYANLLGNEAGRIIYDGGAMIAAGGALLAESRRFSFRDVQIAWADVDLDHVRAVRHHRMAPDAFAGRIVTAPPDSWRLPQRAAKAPLPAAAPDDMRKEEEFPRAVALGLFDYLRKTRSRGFVVSLSGGADSSAVALLVHLMVRLAAAELNGDGIRAKLSHIELRPGDPASLTEQLLWCVYQATANSSTRTAEAAGALARDLGARFCLWDVEDLVGGYTRLVEGALGRPLQWDRDDLALQNIQARVRAPGVWMLANVTGALLLSTSNRSEAAVGYATMDGDTSGGLCPVAGVDKAFLLRWLRFMRQEGFAPVGSFPVLESVISMPPTAELRPGGDQSDEADLMPYDILNRIERLAVLERKGPAEIFAQLRAEQDAPAAMVFQWVERFFRLWSRNQWKRERYAPSFHLDDENLDPKTWCRFPILSGGFTAELEELAASIARNDVQ